MGPLDIVFYFSFDFYITHIKFLEFVISSLKPKISCLVSQITVDSSSLFCPTSFGKHFAYAKSSRRVFELGSLAIPLVSSFKVLLHAFAVLVHWREYRLGLCITLLSKRKQ